MYKPGLADYFLIFLCILHPLRVGQNHHNLFFSCTARHVIHSIVVTIFVIELQASLQVL